MIAPSVDIKDMLEAESSLGLTFGTDLFIGREPTTPNDCVTIFDTPGRGPELLIGNASNYNYPSIQIRVRDANYLDGWNLIDGIKVALHGRGPETWNAATYTLIECTTEPALLDWDENYRCRFIVNFDIQRKN